MAVSSFKYRGNAANNVLVIAVWFGLVAGLLEGAGSLILQRMGRMDGVWVEILWVSPVFDTLLFGILGAVLVLAYFIYRRLPAVTLAVFLFATMTFYIWIGLALPWGIHIAAHILLSVGLASVVTRWFHGHQDISIRFWRRSLPVVAAIALITVMALEGSFWL